MSPEIESFHALAAPMSAKKYQPNPLRITFNWKLAPQLGFRRAFQPSLRGYMVVSRRAGMEGLNPGAAGERPIRWGFELWLLCYILKSLRKKIFCR